MRNRLFVIAALFLVALMFGSGAGNTSAAMTSTSRADLRITAPAMAKFVYVSAGATMAAITDKGTLFTWGKNTYGTVGDGSTIDRHYPVRISVPGVTGWVAVDSGDNHMVAVTNDGRLFTWGRNDVGQLGDGTTSDRYVPTEVVVPGASEFFTVSSAADTTVALNQTGVSGSTPIGVPYAWGTNSDIAFSSTPALVVGASPYATISVGTNYAVAAATAEGTSGRQYIWGDGPMGYKAVNSTLATGSSVNTAHDWVATIYGSGLSYSLRGAGGNEFGQLSDGTTNPSTTWVVISGIMSWPELPWSRTVISAKTGVAMRANGVMYFWGDNSFGQYGNNTTTSSDDPIIVAMSAKMVSLGQFSSDPHSPVTVAAINSADDVITWGSNENGQLGVGTVGGISPSRNTVKVFAAAP